MKEIVLSSIPDEILDAHVSSLVSRSITEREGQYEREIEEVCTYECGCAFIYVRPLSYDISVYQAVKPCKSLDRAMRKLADSHHFTSASWHEAKLDG